MNFNEIDRFFHREMDILQDDLDRGIITYEEYVKSVRDLERAADEEETRYIDERLYY